ncbi:MAG: DUF2284 domain-containing protein [Proteobacteria bacterium]|nr:DUF2284 domain-containing protein [Pseudomonadota bacterium]MBU4606863.1 DUF2284 domain-containing protein [Pseudomonadota bacterium]MCG2766456.1 DUF2284 domain-containing protein [Desulfarculaceae bacterium]
MREITINIEYTTSSKNTYPLEMGFSILKSQDVPINNKITAEACKKGCNLYGKNGGCPPFSPKFQNICRKNTLFIYVKISTKFYPKKVLNGPYYTRWVFVETFMTSLTNKIGKHVSGKLDGYFLSSGNCHGCRPKRCAVKEGNPCRNRDARTYSLESTGILVTEVIKKVFNFELQWWAKDEQKFIPDYMVKCIGITSDMKLDKLEVKKEILNYFNLNKITIV